jgi:hypothetical protein
MRLRKLHPTERIDTIVGVWNVCQWFSQRGSNDVEPLANPFISLAPGLRRAVGCKLTPQTTRASFRAAQALLNPLRGPVHAGS